MHLARALTASLAMALLAGSASEAATAKNVRAGTDWTRTFSVTPQGGFRMGNPKAKLAVVEYGSLTCPHCRHFAETGVKPLVDRYVRTGKASYEVRSFVLNGIDLSATLVARCSGPTRFFPIAEQLYAKQPVWSGKVEQLPQDQQEKLGALPQGEMMLAIAKVSGLLPIAAAHGIPVAKSQACLKDEAASMRLVKMNQAANALGVHGTPTFFVNGKQVSAYDWETLQPFLKEAGS